MFFIINRALFIAFMQYIKYIYIFLYIIFSVYICWRNLLANDI